MTDSGCWLQTRCCIIRQWLHLEIRPLSPSIAATFKQSIVTLCYFKYGCHKGTLRVLQYPEWFVLTKTLQSKANCCYYNTTYFLLFPMLLLLLKCSLQINFDNPNVIILSTFKHYLFNVDVVKNHNSAGFSLPSLAALHMDMYQRNIHLPGRLGMIQTPYTYSAQNR